MLIGMLLVLFAIYIFTRALVLSKKKKQLRNNYISQQKKKLQNDYNDYLEWCKLKGEPPIEKEGFDEQKMQEYQMYKKLIKHGISGLDK